MQLKNQAGDSQGSPHYSECSSQAQHNKRRWLSLEEDTAVMVHLQCTPTGVKEVTFSYLAVYVCALN